MQRGGGSAWAHMKIRGSVEGCEKDAKESTKVRKTIFFVDDTKLAEIVCQTKVVPCVMSYRYSGKHFAPAEVHTLPTRVITITTYGSHMDPEHFGIEQNDSRAIGNHSEDMKFALIGFVLRGANVSVQSKSLPP